MSRKSYEESNQENKGRKSIQGEVRKHQGKNSEMRENVLNEPVI